MQFATLLDKDSPLCMGAERFLAPISDLENHDEKHEPACYAAPNRTLKHPIRGGMGCSQRKSDLEALFDR
jgi:hypothetical protein